MLGQELVSTIFQRRRFHRSTEEIKTTVVIDDAKEDFSDGISGFIQSVN